MGFRNGAYAKIWYVTDMENGAVIKGREYPAGNYSFAKVTIGRKNKETGEYNVDFSDGFVRLVCAAREKAKSLDLPTAENFDFNKDKGAYIQISSCDVSHKYVKEYEKTFTNFTIFDFEIVEDNEERSNGNTKKKSYDRTPNDYTKKKSAIQKQELVEDDDLLF